MMRLTPEIILEAYEKTGMIPKIGCFNDGGCGCAMGVFIESNDKKDDVLDYFKKYYRWGLYAGFDGKEMIMYGDETYEQREDYETGYKDGASIRQAVIERYGEFE